MITNEILEEKWRTQKRMAEEAGYNVRKYARNVHRTVEKLVEEHGLKLRYAKRKPLKPVFDKSSAG